MRSEVIIRDGHTDYARTVRLTGLRKAAARRLVESGCSVRRPTRSRQTAQAWIESHSRALLKHMVKRCGPQTQDGARLCVTARDISAMTCLFPNRRITQP
jgi:histone H3/H4